MSIITKGMGDSSTLITKGYGSTLVVVVAPVGGGGSGPPRYEEPYYGPLIPGQKQTITLKVPTEESPITVDVVLVAQDGDITVDAVLSKYKYDYETIEVYSIDEVEIYD